MTAYNMVRMRVKPGREQDFLNAGKAMTTFKGFRKGAMVKLGHFDLWRHFDFGGFDFGGGSGGAGPSFRDLFSQYFRGGGGVAEAPSRAEAGSSLVNFLSGLCRVLNIDGGHLVRTKPATVVAAVESIIATAAKSST